MCASKRLPRKLLRLAHRMWHAMAVAQAGSYCRGKRASRAVILARQAGPAVFPEKAGAVMERIHHFFASRCMGASDQHVLTAELQQPLHAAKPGCFQDVRRSDPGLWKDELEQRLRRIV